MQNSTHSTYMYNYIAKTNWLFNHRVATLVASWRDSGYERFTVIGRLILHYANQEAASPVHLATTTHWHQPSWRN